LAVSGLFLSATAAPTDCFARGNAVYEAGDFAQAVILYDSAAQQSARAGVFYNRGNAYFKLNRVGRAIADYTRAYALAPQDKDVRYNLAFARQYRPDKTLTIENPLVKLSTGLLRLLDHATLRVLAGVLFLLALGSAALLLVRGQRWFGWAAIVLGVLFLYCFVAGLSWSGVVSSDRAVVVAMELTLRSGPGGEYKEIAVVHDGLEVTVRERRPGYVLVQIPGGEGGWAEAAAVELVFPKR
jgi:tetratricopeptide (TPR) repeat protein